MARRPPPLVRSSDRPGIAQLLNDFYPRIYRIAAALTGTRAAADKVSQRMLSRSLRQLPRWTSPADAQRWFLHHTVLTARQWIAGHGYGGVAGLVPTETPADAQEQLLFRLIHQSLGVLSVQQREAFLLHHGEGLDLRQLATAMDCSTTAASNHLVAAVQRLRPAVGDRLNDFAAALPLVLAQVVPPPANVVLRVEKQVRRFIWPRRVVRWIGIPLLVAALLAAGWEGWRLWQMLVT